MNTPLPLAQQKEKLEAIIEETNSIFGCSFSVVSVKGLKAELVNNKKVSIQDKDLFYHIDMKFLLWQIEEGIHESLVPTMNKINVNDMY